MRNAGDNEILKVYDCLITLIKKNAAEEEIESRTPNRKTISNIKR